MSRSGKGKRDAGDRVRDSVMVDWTLRSWLVLAAVVLLLLAWFSLKHSMKGFSWLGVDFRDWEEATVVNTTACISPVVQAYMGVYEGYKAAPGSHSGAT